MRKPSTARIHILIARDAPVGLVIRRGPAKQVATFSWDRRSDEIKLAQWMHGRIYERRCDLSPDGRHWIYFAMNGRWSSQGKGAWTCVARAPWLRAKIFLPKGDCWQGGGLFLSNDTYWVNGGACHGAGEGGIRSISENTSYSPPEWYGGECLTGYYNRLQRDDWVLTSLQSKRNPHLLTVLERRLPRGWTLQKVCKVRTGREQGKAIYYDEHTLVNDEGELQSFPEWEWAEWVDGRIVFAEAGILQSRIIKSAKRLGDPIPVHDFNGYTFEAREAPY